MLTERQYAGIGKQLDEVLACGQQAALDWLKGAFYTHAEQKEQLLADFRELGQLFLAAVARPLTVREAQLLQVCRVCRGKPTGPFLLNFGEEHAHERCVKPAAAFRPEEARA